MCIYIYIYIIIYVSLPAGRCSNDCSNCSTRFRHQHGDVHAMATTTSTVMIRKAGKNYLEEFQRSFCIIISGWWFQPREKHEFVN